MTSILTEGGGSPAAEGRFAGGGRSHQAPGGKDRAPPSRDAAAKGRRLRVVGPVRREADAAASALGFKRPYHVDADHIRIDTVDGYIPQSGFFTLDGIPIYHPYTILGSTVLSAGMSMNSTNAISDTKKNGTTPRNISSSVTSLSATALAPYTHNPTGGVIIPT